MMKVVKMISIWKMLGVGLLTQRLVEDAESALLMRYWAVWQNDLGLVGAPVPSSHSSSITIGQSG